MEISTTLDQLVGNTPLLEVETVNGATIYAKMEMQNPAGSIKDRIALEMVKEAFEKGLLHPGDKAVEATSGNTGIGLAFVCSIYGIHLTVLMPENMSKERQTLMKAYGAEIVLTPKEGGMALAEKMAEEYQAKGYFFFDQFHNEANWHAHYRHTGPEIEEQTQGNIDIFLAGFGTSGTLTGVGKYLKERHPELKLIGMEPEESPLLSEGHPGPHKIQGIGANFVPPLLDENLVDEIIRIPSEKAWEKANEMAKKGLFLGISAAANLLGAEAIASRPENAGKRIVTVFPDGGSKYLSLDIYGK